MNPIVLAYVLNIVVLIPVASLTLFGGEIGNRRVFQNKFTESEGTRTILGSLWTAILIGSCVGLFYPVQMSPILILQVIYKSLWLLVFVVPRLVTGRGRGVPWGVTITFLVIVVCYPWIIPWILLFGSH